MAHEFPSISFAADLLNAMMDNPSLHSGQPSEDVLTYLRHIEDADPNDLDIKENDTNSS